MAAVAAGAQDYLVKGKVDGQVLIRAVRYAVERRRAEASLLRLREEQLAAAESARLERGLLPSPLLAGSPVRARSFYRAGRTRSVIGGDFFDAVLGPTGTVHAIVGDVCGHGPDEAALGALLRVSWRALVLAGRGRAAAAAQAAAGAGQRAARPVAVHHGVHDRDPGGHRRAARRWPCGWPGTRRRCSLQPQLRPLDAARRCCRWVCSPDGDVGAAHGAARPRLGAAAPTPTASSRVAARSPASRCGRRGCSTCWRRSATPAWTGCPPGSSSGRRASTGGRWPTTSRSCSVRGREPVTTPVDRRPAPAPTPAAPAPSRCEQGRIGRSRGCSSWARCSPHWPPPAPWCSAPQRCGG